MLARKRRTDLGQTTLHTLLDEAITPAERAWGWRVSADGPTQSFPIEQKFHGAPIRDRWNSVAAFAVNLGDCQPAEPAAAGDAKGRGVGAGHARPANREMGFPGGLPTMAIQLLSR